MLKQSKVTETVFSLRMPAKEVGKIRQIDRGSDAWVQFATGQRSGLCSHCTGMASLAAGRQELTL